MMYEPRVDMSLWKWVYELGMPPGDNIYAFYLVKHEGVKAIPFLFKALRNPIPYTAYMWNKEASLKESKSQITKLLRELVEQDQLTMPQLVEYRKLIEDANAPTD